MTFSQPYRRRYYKTGRAFSVGPLAARYLTLILLAIFSLMFLVQSTQAANYTFGKHQLEVEQKGLKQELTTLEANASRWQSIKTLTDSATAGGLVPVGADIGSLTVTPLP